MKMLKKISLFSIILLLISCSTVEFEQPVPNLGEKIIQFSSVEQGRYIGIENKDTLIIGSDYFIHSIDSKQRKKIVLADKNVVLKRFEGVYILNVKSNDDSTWLALPLKITKKGLELYYLSLVSNKKNKKKKKKEEDKMFEKLQLITQVKEIKDSTNQIQTILISPNDDELRELWKKGLFQLILKYRKLP